MRKSGSGKQVRSQAGHRDRTIDGEAGPRRASPFALFAGGLLLLLAVMAAHGWCLRDGSVLDDHWHQHNLRTIDWTLPELVRGTVIEPSQWVHLWWQDKPVHWEYARPLFILIMKFVYRVLGGDDPFGLHLFSVILHWACAAMTWRLARQASGSEFWSWLASVVFVVYPHAVMTVQWPSAQNVVLQTALVLAALLCYARGSLDSGGTLLRNRDDAAPLPAPAAPSWLWPAFGFWLLAIFARENSVLFPAMFMALDLAAGGWRRTKSRMAWYALYGLAGFIFVLWRVTTIKIGMPDVYVRRPEGDGLEYLGWCAAKFVHYLCTAVWPAPMTIGPTGRYNPWTEAPRDGLLMLGIVAATAFVFWLCARHRRGWWLWPLWIVLAILPVVPVVATPHSGYPCGVAVAVGLAIGASRWNEATSRPRWTAHLARTATIVNLVAMSGMTLLNRWQWTGTIACERMLASAVAADPPATTASDVFFINIPFVNVYCKPQLDRLYGATFRPLRAHVLAFAPQPFLVEERVIVEQMGERMFSLEVVGQPFFSRLLGRFLIDGFRKDGVLRAGQRIDGPHFSVTIDQADEQGVKKLVFRFARPLADPSYCFYLASAECPAAQLRFAAGGAGAAGPPGSRASSTAASREAPTDATVESLQSQLEIGHVAAFDLLRAAARNPDPGAALAIERAARTAAARIAVATGSQLQEMLLGKHVQSDPLAPPPRIAPPTPPAPLPPLSDAEWAQVSAWWHASVHSQQLVSVLGNRAALEPYYKQREELPHARQWAGLVFRTDLYMTGPPFPGPRAIRR